MATKKGIPWNIVREKLLSDPKAKAAYDAEVEAERQEEEQVRSAGKKQKPLLR